MHTNTTTDIAPWYRQFWPWFVISIPAATVIACLVTIVIAWQHREPVIDSTPAGQPAAVRPG